MAQGVPKHVYDYIHARIKKFQEDDSLDGTGYAKAYLFLHCPIKDYYYMIYTDSKRGLEVFAFDTSIEARESWEKLYHHYEMWKKGEVEAPKEESGVSTGRLV